MDELGPLNCPYCLKLLDGEPNGTEIVQTDYGIAVIEDIACNRCFHSHLRVFLYDPSMNCEAVAHIPKVLGNDNNN